MKNVHTNIDAVDVLKSEGADIVIEAIVENIDVKQKVFAALDAVAPEKTIFASNTSSLSIARIAAATKREDRYLCFNIIVFSYFIRFGGLHFFNPVPVMKLVEVVKAPKTSEATNLWLLGFGKVLFKFL